MKINFIKDLMVVKFHYSRWGSEYMPWIDFAKKVKDSGYDGIEIYPLQAPQDKSEMPDRLIEKQYNNSAVFPFEQNIL